MKKTILLFLLSSGLVFGQDVGTPTMEEDVAAIRAAVTFSWGMTPFYMGMGAALPFGAFRFYRRLMNPERLE